jgi:ATP-dependent Clp protease ATP-binding subunit ClpC
VFERFTDQARRVVVMAQEESRLLNHDYIGTEHVLLGLVHEEDSVAASALGRCGVTLDSARAAVVGLIGRGGSAPQVHTPFTSRAKKVLELSLREASQHGDHHIGPEHILLGLIREGEGVAIQVLDRLGVDPIETRHAVTERMRDAHHADDPRRLPQQYGSGAGTIRTAQPIVRCPGCGFAIDLAAAAHELQIRMERSGDDPRFRVYVTSGGVSERLVHECEPETTTP